MFKFTAAHLSTEPGNWLLGRFQHPISNADLQSPERIKRNKDVCMRRDSGKRPRKQKYKVDDFGTVKLKLPRKEGKGDLRIQLTHACEKKGSVPAAFQLKLDSEFEKLRKAKEVKAPRLSGRVTKESLGYVEAWLRNLLAKGIGCNEFNLAVRAMASVLSTTALKTKCLDKHRKHFACTPSGLKAMNCLRKRISLIDMKLRGVWLRRKNIIYLRKACGNTRLARLRKHRSVFVRELRRLGRERKAGELASRRRTADSRFKYQKTWSAKKENAKCGSDDGITIEEHRAFWSELWGNPWNGDLECEFLGRFLATIKGTVKAATEVHREIRPEEVDAVLRSVRPNKAAGPDGIPPWILKLSRVTRRILCIIFNYLLSKESMIPVRLTTGRTVLLPKCARPESPKDFRPITVLNTQYKVLTAVIERRLREFLMGRSWWPKEQRAVLKGVRGCHECILVDQAVVELSKGKHPRTLAMGWIDFKKAYDSVDLR